eukprot:10358502-Ditylum_brightwellii.AAC.1
MSSKHFCGVLHCANKVWKHRECTPSSWTRHFLAACFSYFFSHHVLRSVASDTKHLKSKKVSWYLQQDARFSSGKCHHNHSFQVSQSVSTNQTEGGPMVHMLHTTTDTNPTLPLTNTVPSVTVIESESLA